MRLMRAWGCGLLSSLAWAMRGRIRSSAYLVSPATLAQASILGSDCPMMEKRSFFMHSLFSGPSQARLAGLVASGSSAPPRLARLSEPFQARLAGLVASGSSAPPRLARLSEPFQARLAGLVA